MDITDKLNRAYHLLTSINSVFDEVSELADGLGCLSNEGYTMTWAVGHPVARARNQLALANSYIQKFVEEEKRKNR